MKVASEGEKRSAYLAAGAPGQCFLPACRKPFDDKCVHSKDGHYYCSTACVEEARKLDLGRVEELKRKRS